MQTVDTELHYVLTSVLDGCVVNVSPRQFCPGEGTSVPSNWGWGLVGPHSWSQRFAEETELLPLTGIEPQLLGRPDYSSITSAKSPALCMTTFSTSLTNLTTLLLQSRDCT